MTTQTPHRWRLHVGRFGLLRRPVFRDALASRRMGGPNGRDGSTGQPPQAGPADVGMDAAALAKIDGLVEGSLAAHNMPGCVVAIGRHGKVVFFKAYGKRQLEPKPLPMTTDTVFDVASVTKPSASATSIAWLFEHGRVIFVYPVAKYLPEFAAGGKEKVTIRQLLLHQGGLVPDNELSDYADGTEQAWKPHLRPAAEI